MSEHSRRLADEAARRGWQYSPSGDHLRLARRWKWPVRFEHPFEFKAQSSLGLDRRHPVGDVVSGSTPAGRTFWAFWYQQSEGTGHGFGSWVRKSVAFIYTATSLPTVSVVSRSRTGRDGIYARSILSAMDDASERRAHQRSGGDAERLARRYGWAVGDEQFQDQYKVRADDRQAAEWLAGPATRQALLSHQPAISLTSNGADILAWTDYGWTDSRGTDYGGEHIDSVEDLDIPTVAALLEVLDTVPLR